jgi:hypothetical protein
VGGDGPSIEGGGETGGDVCFAEELSAVREPGMDRRDNRTIEPQPGLAQYGLTPEEISCPGSFHFHRAPVFLGHPENLSQSASDQRTQSLNNPPALAVRIDKALPIHA